MVYTRFRSASAIAACLFAAGTFLTWWLCGSYFGASLDEGIYVEGGKRIAGGERLYVDFFAFIGPILYWIQALLSLLFGNQLAQLRLSTAVSIGATLVGLLYLGRSIAGTAAGVLGALAWLGIWLDLPNRMEVNHRWVSMGIYCLAMSVILGAPAASRFWNAVAGGCLGLAVFTTPSFGVSSVLIGAYFLIRDRQRFVPYALGGLASGGAVLLILVMQGNLGGFIAGIQWAVENYSEANRYPYGRFPVEVRWRYFLQIYMGAISIPLSLLMLIGVSIWRKTFQFEIQGMLGLALFGTAYPKWDAYSLHFISGLYLVLIYSFVYLMIPAKLKNLFEGLTLALFAFLLIGAVTLSDRLTVLPTRAGVLMGDQRSARVLEKLEAAVPAGSSLFVYPYLTGLYGLLDGKNHAHYSYLQPGMMTGFDEAIVLSDLERQPPQFIFWQTFPDADVVMLWPNSNPGKHRFLRLESWIRQHYRPDVEATESNIRGQLWIRN